MRGAHQCLKTMARRRMVIGWVLFFYLPEIKTLKKVVIGKHLKRAQRHRCVSLFCPCKHTSVQSSGFLAKDHFSFLLLQCFLLLKINATAKYLSVIWCYLYGSYLNRGYEMKSKLFLLCGESVSVHFLFSSLPAHMSTSVASHCFNTPLPQTMERSPVSKRNVSFGVKEHLLLYLVSWFIFTIFCTRAPCNSFALTQYQRVPSSLYLRAVHFTASV